MVIRTWEGLAFGVRRSAFKVRGSAFKVRGSAFKVRGSGVSSAICVRTRTLRTRTENQNPEPRTENPNPEPLNRERRTPNAEPVSVQCTPGPPALFQPTLLYDSE